MLATLCGTSRTKRLQLPHFTIAAAIAVAPAAAAMLLLAQCCPATCTAAAVAATACCSQLATFLWQRVQFLQLAAALAHLQQRQLFLY